MKTIRSNPPIRFSLFFIHRFIPLLLGILISLGILETTVLFLVRRNVKDIIDTNNKNMLFQSLDSIESVVRDLEYLSLNLLENASMRSLLEAACQEDAAEAAYAEEQLQRFLQPIISAKPYIHSVYLYAHNPFNRFIAGIDGMKDIAEYVDTGWYSYYVTGLKSGQTLWTKRRLMLDTVNGGNIDVITLFHPYESGVLMLNLYKSHIDTEIENLVFYKDQMLVVLNENNESMFLSHPKAPLLSSDISAILRQNKETISGYLLDGKSHYVSILQSPDTLWKCLSFIPHSSMYEEVNQLGLFINLLFLAAIIVCTILCILHTWRSYRNLTDVALILNAARENLAPPVETPKKSNEYIDLLKNMIQVFVEQNHLKQQLSQKKYEARVLEISTLHSQLSPHFLINTLQSIFWMSLHLTGSRNQVSEMIEDMSSILDYVLDEEEALVPLAKEIEISKRYLAIQQKRHQTPLLACWHVSDELADFYCPKLIIQPMLENAVMHAIRPDPAMPLHLSITVVSTEEQLIITVEDDGVGIPPLALQKIRERLYSEKDEGHIGIYNCHRRLSLMFGVPYGLTISSEFNQCTKVQLTLPKLLQDDGDVF